MAKYYLLDENKNFVEGFDKEGFLALLQQAIASGSLENIDEESAVASKLRSVKNGTTHHIEFVTQAQYNQLVADEELVANTWYFITDDTTAEDLDEHITQNDERVSNLEGIVPDLSIQLSENTITGSTFEDLLESARQFYVANKNDANQLKRTCVGSLFLYGQVYKYKIKFVAFVNSTEGTIVLSWERSYFQYYEKGYASYVTSWSIYKDYETDFTKSAWQNTNAGIPPTLKKGSTYHVKYKPLNENYLWDFGLIYMDKSLDTTKVNGKYYIKGSTSTSDPNTGTITLIVGLAENGEPSETLETGTIYYKEIK